jgi:hypothetical protein
MIEFIFIITLGLALVGGGYFIFRHIRQQALLSSLALELFLIRIPRTHQKEGAYGEDFKKEINQTEQLFASLASFRASFVFEVAVPHIGEEIHFNMAVPRELSEAAIKQVQGIWPSASVIPTPDDYNIFNAEGVATAAFFEQKENFALPIRSYQELDADAFSGILSGFSKIREVGEGAALQIIAQPASRDYRREIESNITEMKRGESLEKVFLHKMPWSVKEVKHAMDVEGAEKRKAERIIDEEGLKILDQKMSKPLFLVNVRIVASGPSPRIANEIIDGIATPFGQFSSPRRNEFRIVKPRNAKALLHFFVFRKFDPSKAMVLNVEELASIYHLPTSSTETPKIKWLKSKEATPPADLPKSGLLIGHSSFRGKEEPVYITEDDRRRHIYVVGQTGTGKTTLLSSMFIEDIKAGRGVSIIDPHGDVAESVIGHIPKERLDDLIYFNPGDIMRPMGLNMIDYNFDRPEEKTFIVNEMQSIFNKLFVAETMGPMFEQYMRNALLLLMEDMPNEPATLVEVPRIFTDTEFRKRKLQRISNPVVIDFWEKEAAKAGGEASLANMTPYITSKFNNFIANDYMRPIIGQPKSAFNFREVMDSGKILIINLSKGRIGDINAGLLGMIFTGKLLMAALSRGDIPDMNKRRDFYLYIDEFQNFTTDSISTILSEARKYRLNLAVAHQFIAQLEEKIRDSIFGNVGSQIVMRVGVQDAEFLVKQFAPVFDENDLVNIDNLNAYVKLLANGQTARPFNMKVSIASWTGGDQQLAEKMKEYSRLKYGENREVVEAEIHRRLRK